MRIPLVVLPDYAVSENTYDDIMEVFAWDMRHSLAGTQAVCRHDCSPWIDSDRVRSTKTGLLPLRSCLVQVRADWDWMGKCFHFPFHNVKEGCCWLCRCKRSQVLGLLFQRHIDAMWVSPHTFTMRASLITQMKQSCAHIPLCE